jgi:hypothetical protein
MHQTCLDKAKRVKLDPLPTALRREEQRQSDVMTKLFRLVAFPAKNKLSFRMYEELIVLLHESGVDVGDIDHSRITATSMNEVIARRHGNALCLATKRLTRSCSTLSTCRICTRWNSTRSTPGGPRAVTRWAPSMAVVTAGSRRPRSCAATSQQHRRRSSSRPAIEAH